MSTPPGTPVTATLPRGFPIWPGVVVGVGVAVGLFGIEAMRLLPHALVRTVGGFMAPAHGIIAFAVVTLLGEAWTIAVWDRTLAEQLEQFPPSHPGHSPLIESGDPSARSEEIAENSREFLQRWSETRRLGQIVTYLVPVIGFGVSSWDSGSPDPWTLVAQPLLLSLGEAFFVLLLIVEVSHASQVVGDGWRLLTKMLLAGPAGDDGFPGMTLDPEPPAL